MFKNPEGSLESYQETRAAFAPTSDALTNIVKSHLSDAWSSIPAAEIGAKGVFRITQDLTTILPDPAYDNTQRFNVATALYEILKGFGFTSTTPQLPTPKTTSRSYREMTTLRELLDALVANADDHAEILPYIRAHHLVREVNGKWKYGMKLSIGINAALGKGAVLAGCYKPNQAAATLTYTSIPYTIAGAVPTFTVAQPSYTQGQTLRATSSTPCPNPNSYVTGYIENMTTPGFYSELFPVPNSANGNWYVDWEVVKQAWINGKLQDAPPGQHRISVRCSGTTDDLSYSVKYFDIKAFSHYVALGDSYSSGEGTFDYDIASGACHRSPKAYAYNVATRQKLGVPVFAACSGAQTYDFYSANPNKPGEPRQLDRLTAATKVVTLTIGGNDAGFVRVLEECAHDPETPGFGCSTRPALISATNSHLAALAGTSAGNAEDGRKIESLKSVYKSIRTAAPNAKIYVAGYPRLFGTDKTKYTASSGAPSKFQCTMTVPVTIDYADAQWINGRATALNKVITDAIAASGANIFYVPPALFSGHGQCDTQEQWINTIVLDSAFKPQPESVHPNVVGQSAGYGAAFVSVMNQH